MILAAVVGCLSTTQEDINSDYVELSSNLLTCTFKKKVKGYYMCASADIVPAQTTATIQQITERRAYTMYVYYFEANVGQTIVYNSLNSSGYAIVCMDN